MGKRTYAVSSFLVTIGAAGFLVSSLIYYDFLTVGTGETLSTIDVSYQVGFIGSLALMALSLAGSFWTADTKTLTFFGAKEWLATLAMVIFVLLPHAIEDLWTQYQLVMGSVAILVGIVFWIIAVRDSR